MKFDLVRPCDNCPFRKDGGQIKFADIERAKEIEEMAYREGFVCHEHADYVEEDDYLLESEGYYERQDGSSQHCFGALFMYIGQGDANIPWETYITENEANEGKWWDHLTSKQISHAHKVVFEDPEKFFEANGG